MKNNKKTQKKASWRGKVLSVQPRVLVKRKQKALNALLLGYNLLIEGDITLQARGSGSCSEPVMKTAEILLVFCI
jgi:hypothetical protein